MGVFLFLYTLQEHESAAFLFDWPFGIFLFWNQDILLLQSAMARSDLHCA